jgi:CubicO group peptidase (beta-lactamase class C family)
MRALFLSLFLALATPAAAQTPVPPAPTAAPGGAVYVLPEGWTAIRKGELLALAPAESDLHIVIVGVGEAKDARAAADAAWAAWRPQIGPGAGHAFKLLTPRPPRQGWDEQAVIDYDTSPAEHLVLNAIARRAGKSWVVLLIDGSEATMEKREGTAVQIIQTLRPASYVKESFAGRTAHPLDPARVQQMVDFVRDSAGKLGIPGVGFALYDNHRIVFEGGVGVRELGKPAPVDAHTRFIIASNTKSMATLLLAKLVDAGKIRWDEKVIDVYPSFRLGSDATTKTVEIRHLVCACTGLPRKDMEMLFSTTAQTPASETFRLLAATEPTSKFGEAFQYNNLMASAAGYIAGHLYFPDMELGAAFDRAVQTQILDPLQMKDTTLSMEAALADPDHASPHGEDFDNKVHVIGQDLNRSFIPFRPAGGAWSSAHDLIVYMRNELDEGLLPNGQRLVSREALLARRARGVAIGEDQWYGMGLMDDASMGVDVIHHGGDLDGYHSEMFAIPGAGVAAVILTNDEPGPFLRSAFLRRLLEVLYDGKPEAGGNIDAAVKRIAAEAATEKAKLTIPGDPGVLGGLASAYTNPDLGRVTFSRSGADTVLHVPGWSSALVTRKNADGSQSIITSDPMLIGVEMTVGTAAGKRTLTVRDGQHVYVFSEVS